MLRFRVLLAWLVMAVLPLQGFAAASMLFCGTAPAARVSQAHGHDGHEGHPHHAPAASTAGHDHAAHGHAAADPASADQDKQGHACAVCASCCQVVAVGGFNALARTGDAPSVQPPHPMIRVVTRTTSVPDKPPRA